MKRIAIAALLLLGACHREAKSPEILQAWIRLPAVAGRPAAAYFTVVGGRTATRLTRVESALAGRAELHESMAMAGGMAGMQPLDHVDLAAGQTVRFAPGGKHVMLFDLNKAVAPGTAIPLRFGFADRTTAEAEAKTVPAGGDAPY